MACPRHRPWRPPTRTPQRRERHLDIARWDGTGWHALGAGLTGPDLPYGRVLLSWRGFIVVAGNFLYAGDVAAPRVAAWDGMSWWPLCGGLNNWAEGLAPWNEGVVAGGWFSHVATGGPVGFGSWAPDPTRWPSTRTISIGSRDPGTPWVPHLNPDACSVDPDQTNRSRVQVPRPVDLILRPAMEAPDAGG